MRIVWLTVTAVTIGYLSSRDSNVRGSMWLVIVFVLGLRFLINTLLAFYILFELSLIPILIMILTQGGQPERLSARVYFLFYTATFSLPYLVLILIISPIRFFNFRGLLQRGGLSSFLLLAPFLVKIPMFGVHF
jgi:NADH:ubiquinone oxidoreductase subunit 4 (subunit M)